MGIIKIKMRLSLDL